MDLDFNVTSANKSGPKKFEFAPQQKILLVEDSPESEMLMRHMCGTINQNLSIECVKTGEAALFLLIANSRYDLIIADQFLAGITTGLDLWKACREKFKDIPFMMTSALTRKEFLSIAWDDFKPPFYLPKTLSINDQNKILANFLQSSTKIPRTNREFTTFNKEVINIPTKKIHNGLSADFANLVIAVSILFALHLINLLHQSFQPQETSKTKNLEYLQPSKNTKANTIITPELRQKIGTITEKADETHKIISHKTYLSE